MREGRTLTRTMQIETKQHELFGINLGEGAPRRALVFGMLVFACWWTLLALVIGGPTKQTSLVWVLPPGFLAIYGWRESERNPRRRLVTEWVLAVRWLVRGHRPIIALGRHTITRADCRGWVDRLAHRVGQDDPLAILMPWRLDNPTKHATTQARRQAKKHARQHRIRIEGSVQLVGSATARDHVVHLVERTKTKANKKRASRRAHQ